MYSRIFAAKMYVNSKRFLWSERNKKISKKKRVEKINLHVKIKWTKKSFTRERRKIDWNNGGFRGSFGRCQLSHGNGDEQTNARVKQENHSTRPQVSFLSLAIYFVNNWRIFFCILWCWARLRIIFKSKFCTHTQIYFSNFRN